ncbi:hypothetical protein J6590_030128 [Homalodisca vitripennis]|nr:hypothetical protein J6590_030128 [Homalodisca vitripennis]
MLRGLKLDTHPQVCEEFQTICRSTWYFEMKALQLLLVKFNPSTTTSEATAANEGRKVNQLGIVNPESFHSYPSEYPVAIHLAPIRCPS